MSQVHCPRPSISSSDHEYSYFLPPTPPPTKSQLRRPSITVAMNWLTHKSNSSLTSLASFTSSKNNSSSSISVPIRISEPQLKRTLDDDLSLQPRTKSHGRTLGQGAEIIGAPYEALERSLPPRRDLPPIPASPYDAPVTPPSISLRTSKSSPHLPASPTKLKHSMTASPPMPSVPLPESSKSALKPTATVVPPFTPLSTPPEQSLPLPNDQSLGVPTIQTTSPSIYTYPIVPPPAPQPAFEPVVLGSFHSIPSHVEPTKVVVTLETSTVTYRTTLGTLLSRPSALSTYIRQELMDEPDEDSSQRAPSPFTRAFNDHLSSEVMGINSNRLHIFLDRPSAPYAHILAYLRSPSDALASLPRAVQFGAAPLSSSITITKLDAIFELRDEAVYLGLDELVQLCDNELKSWYGMKRDSAQPPLPSSHRRGRSGGPPGLRPTRTSLNTPLTSASNVTIKPPAAINTSAKHAQRSEGSDEEDHLVSIMPAMDSPAAIASHESGHGGRSRSSSRNRSDVPPPRPPNPYTSGVAPTVRHNRGGTTGNGSSTSNWI